MLEDNCCFCFVFVILWMDIVYNPENGEIKKSQKMYK